MCPGVKVTNYWLRKVYKQRRIKLRNVKNTVFLKEKQIENKQKRQRDVFPTIIDLAARRKIIYFKDEACFTFN